MHQQLGQTMLDRLEMAEPSVGGIQLLHQLADALLEMLDPRMVGEGKLEAIDLLHQSLDHASELTRLVLATLIARFERVGELSHLALEPSIALRGIASCSISPISARSSRSVLTAVSSPYGAVRGRDPAVDLPKLLLVAGQILRTRSESGSDVVAGWTRAAPALMRG